jgi:hypothetical protein
MAASSARRARGTSGTSPDIDPRTLRGAGEPARSIGEWPRPRADARGGVALVRLANAGTRSEALSSDAGATATASGAAVVSAGSRRSSCRAGSWSRCRAEERSARTVKSFESSAHLWPEPSCADASATRNCSGFSPKDAPVRPPAATSSPPSRPRPQLHARRDRARPAHPNPAAHPRAARNRAALARAEIPSRLKCGRWS